MSKRKHSSAVADTVHSKSVQRSFLHQVTERLMRMLVDIERSTAFDTLFSRRAPDCTVTLQTFKVHSEIHLKSCFFIWDPFLLVWGGRCSQDLLLEKTTRLLTLFIGICCCLTCCDEAGHCCVLTHFVFSLVSMLFICPVFALILYLVLYAYTIYSTYFSIFMSFIWEWCDCDHIIKWCQCWSFFWKKLCSHFCLSTTNRSTVFTEIMDSKFKTSTN